MTWIENFIKKNTSMNHAVWWDTSWLKGNEGKSPFLVKRFKCPYCDYYITNDEKTSYHQSAHTIFFNNFIKHLKAKIRCSPDIKHLKLAVEIFGKKEAMKMISRLREKSSLDLNNYLITIKNATNQKGATSKR